jgi:exopolysaccharide production protein ExoQ
MPPSLALVLTLLLIFYLLRRDFTLPYRPSAALWIPTTYIVILGSRTVTEWVNLGTPSHQLQGNIEEGSPIDRAVFLSLIIAAFCVLLKRRISWSLVLRNNVWLLLFFVYCGISILWSDFPFVAFKRWFRALGDPVMVMVLMSDPQPVKAVEALIKRCAYFIIPLSVLFIKYYPALGRYYSEWTGEVQYTGVAMNKNMLAYTLFVCGLFFIFKFFRKENKGHVSQDRSDRVVAVIFALLVVWLFMIIDAKTATVCIAISSGIALGLGLGNVRKHLNVYLMIALAVFIVLHLWLGVTEYLLKGLGRDSTFTGRTDLWPVVLSMASNPIFGQGFESFWLGERLIRLQSIWFWKPNQAHNGYIEMYLNLGWVGLFLFTGVILSGYGAMRKALRHSVETQNTEMADFAKLGTGYLISYLIFNYTDAAFRSGSFLFVIFLIFTLRYPLREQFMQSSQATVPLGIRSSAPVPAREDMYPVGRVLESP